jgi:hypothetical protein
MANNNDKIQIGETTTAPTIPISFDFQTHPIGGGRAKRVGICQFQYANKHYDLRYESQEFNENNGSVDIKIIDWKMKRYLLDQLYIQMQNLLMCETLDDAQLKQNSDIRGVFIDGEFYRIYPTKLIPNEAGGISSEPNPEYKSLKDFVERKGSL